MRLAVATNAAQEAQLVRQQIRQYTKELRARVRAGGLIIKKAIIATLRSGSPLRFRPRPSSWKARPKIGPLDRSIRVQVREGPFGLYAKIGLAPRGWYGRYQEAGLDATAETRERTRKGRGLGTYVVRQHRFHLPPRPFIEPSALRVEPQVATLIGDSFGVFQSGQQLGGVFDAIAA